MNTKNIIIFLLSIVLFSCRKENIHLSANDQSLLGQLKMVVLQANPTQYAAIQWADARPVYRQGVLTGYTVSAGTGAYGTRKLIAWRNKEKWQCLFLGIQRLSVKGEPFAGEILSESVDGKDKQWLSIDNNTTQQMQVMKDGHLLGGTLPAEQSNTMQEMAIQTAPTFPPGIIRINNSYYYWVNISGSWGGDPGSGQQSVVTYLNTDAPGDAAGGGEEHGEIVQVEYYDVASLPGINIEKLFNCFDAVPDFPGTTYEISLNTDLPMNSYPGSPADFLYSPGHTFITINKTNSYFSVTKNFGFYPVSGFTSIIQENVPSKIVNDSQHEINAKITISMSQNEFNSIRANAIVYANQLYNIKTNNCSDFAINLFNLARINNNKIILPPYNAKSNYPIPYNFWVNSAPQTLFSYLKQKKESNSPDAPNIIIDQTGLTRSVESVGECN